MYSRTVGFFGKVGSGPFGFALTDTPRPLATRMRLFNASKRTEVGYMPTGMKPSGLESPGFSTLKTARLLLSALATNRILPSGVRHRLFGVLPLGALAE